MARAKTSDDKKRRVSAEGALLHRRIVVKAGTNLIIDRELKLDRGMINSLVAQIADLRRDGAQVLLVTSGAVAAGRHALAQKETTERRDVPFRQVLAAIGQSRLMHAYEEAFARSDISVAQALLTRGDIADRLAYLNTRNTLLALLALDVVPIINENDVVAVEELEGESFGDNDTLSAMVANLVDADLLVMLSDIDGLYTADPHTHQQAHLITRVEKVDAEVEAVAGGPITDWGRGGMATKVEAARLATASGVEVAIAYGREEQVLRRIATGETLGTQFPPSASKLESRQRWMLGAVSSHGALEVDAGAVQALRQGNRSLLPAGIHKVKGTFVRGEVVPIEGPEGERVAVGIVNYSDADVESIKGQRSDRIPDFLSGYHYGAEVVHRNNMVVL